MPSDVDIQELIRAVRGAQFEHYTDRAAHIFAAAEAERERLGHHYIGTEHVLLALLADPDSIAARVLGDLGVDLTRARERVEVLYPKS